MEHCGYQDSHLHLQDPRFNGVREDVLQRAAQVGVNRMFCNATREEDWQAVLDLASTTETILPFLGIHPWYCATISAGWVKRLADILANTTSGIGEAGLDKNCRCSMATQIEVFSTQLQLAATFHRPLSIHCLGCWGKVLEILEMQAEETTLPPIIFHSFSGSRETMQRLIKLGCHLSFSGRLTTPSQGRLRLILQQTPLSSILLETDAPDQLADTESEHPAITGNNEPANIMRIYAFTADLLHIPLQQLCRQIWHNGTLFKNSALPR